MSVATPAKAASGARRAATLLLVLGEEAAGRVLGHLSERELETVGVEMAKLGQIGSEEVREVLGEYLKHVPLEGALSGGIDKVEKLMAGARGEGKKLVERIARATATAPALDVAQFDPASLSGILEAEPPQAAALVLSRLDPKAAGQVLAHMTPAGRVPVALRVARLGPVDPDTLEQVLGSLRLRVASLGQPTIKGGDGVKSLAAILNHTGAEVANDVLESIEEESAELAAKVREQSVLFEDVLWCDDRAMAAFVQRVDKKLLSIALKGSTEEIQAKFFRGMSERAGQNLREEMQLAGPVRVAEVEKAQLAVVQVLKKLMEEGVVVLNKGGEGLVA